MTDINKRVIELSANISNSARHSCRIQFNGHLTERPEIYGMLLLEILKYATSLLITEEARSALNIAVHWCNLHGLIYTGFEQKCCRCPLEQVLAS